MNMNKANPAAAAEARPQRGIQSLDSTGALLEALAAADAPLALSDLAAAANMPAAKAFPHLVSLQKIGLIARNAAGRFEAGPLALELGLIGLQRLSPTREAGAEVVELAATTGMSVAMAVLGPLGPTVVRLEESPRPLHVSLRVGTVMSLVNTALGRVFAAYIADDVRRDLLDQDALRLAGAAPADIFATLSAASPRISTYTSPRASHAARPLEQRYAERLAQIRAHGIDHALNKPIPGIHTLAAPVFDHTGSICLSIAIMGPAGSVDAEIAGGAAASLLAATRRLSHRFGHAPPVARASMSASHDDT